MTEPQYSVVWAEDALDDLDRLARHLHDEVPYEAPELLDRILTRVESLAVLPNRGRRPPELAPTETWLEVIEAPWRILNRVIERTVEVTGIFDGRRDLHLLMIERARQKD